MRLLRRLVVLVGLVVLVRFLILRKAASNVDEPVRPVGDAQWPPIDPDPDPTPPSTAPVADDTVAMARPMPTWVVPEDGVCPLSHPIKVNGSSGIFHVPGGRFYDRTIPERCYADPDDAVADGYRAAKA